MKNFFLPALLFFIFLPPAVFGEDTLFVAELPSPHEYDLFANGGWNGNWYVGYDHCWIEKLPPIRDIKKYKRAFLGAKMGRAKTPAQIKKIIDQRVAEKKKKLTEASDKEKDALNAQIKELEKKKKFANEIKFFASVSQDPDFSDDEKYFLARNLEIPLDGDYNEALDFVGESRWFWVEIPVSEISRKVPNYVALWSDNPLLTSVSFAPVLAAGWSDSQEKDSFLTTGNKGKKPRVCEKNISFFSPALAIKLVPESTVRKIFVKIESLKREKKVLRIFADCSADIERIRMRLFRDDEEIPTGFGICSRPYVLSAKNLASGSYKVFLEASDYDGNFAKSRQRNFEIK
ncbi:MAG: hypothetical protein J7L54_01015 [Elusimicrobia bacterium]|nr:hypothetical protein [Elusimicrobiota bacterium]